MTRLSRRDLLRRAIEAVSSVPGREGLPACDLDAVPIWRAGAGGGAGHAWVARWKVDGRRVQCSFIPSGAACVLVVGDCYSAMHDCGDDPSRYLAAALAWLRAGDIAHLEGFP